VRISLDTIEKAPGAEDFFHTKIVFGDKKILFAKILAFA